MAGRSGPLETRLHSPDGRLAADPTVTVGRDGSVHVTWLGFHVNPRSDAGPYDMAVYHAQLTAPPGRSVHGAEPVVLARPGETLDRPVSVLGG